MNIPYLDWDFAIQKAVLQFESDEKIWNDLADGASIVFLRDWQGFLHLCLPCSRSQVEESLPLISAIQSCHEAFGVLSVASGLDNDIEALVNAFVLFDEETTDRKDLWESPDLILLSKRNIKLFLLERQDKEQDWLRSSILGSQNSSARRAVFFGVKGGVGRSTAIVGLSHALAKAGKKVLVVDCDFESPGISSSLISAVAKPAYGMVDWFAAEGLGFGSKEELFQIGTIVEISPLSRELDGSILVAPAFDEKSEAYISKLGRLYSTTAGPGPKGTVFKTYADRLSEVIGRLETAFLPDVVLIDSRAGIDDTSAVALTRLGAVAFLFGINTQQTWDAYTLLFRHWQQHPSLGGKDDFREYLRFVSALTPDEALYPGYLSEMQSTAYEVFGSTLYDQLDEEDGTLDGFNFAFDAENAPHHLLVIRRDDALLAFDPVKHPEHVQPAIFDKVFGDFVPEAIALLTKE